jgi:5-hydroxyisourate hydrolase-like protein (transthyretin family)
VLDDTTEQPAEGVAPRLDKHLDGEWRTTAHGRTHADARITALGDPRTGIHRLNFDTGGLLRRRKRGDVLSRGDRDL